MRNESLSFRRSPILPHKGPRSGQRCPGQRAEGAARALAQGVIWGYRIFLSPLLAAECRFFPSCSEYASEAIDRHGLLRGGMKTLLRLLRCHPIHPGGFDPVSE